MVYAVGKGMTETFTKVTIMTIHGINLDMGPESIAYQITNSELSQPLIVDLIVRRRVLSTSEVYAVAYFARKLGNFALADIAGAYAE